MAARKLLLADDSITIQKVVKLTFSDEGIEVISVGDGDIAVQRIFEEMPDVVMADINMPGLSGYQVCERVRGDEKTAHIPVVLLFGAFEKFDEAEAARVGASSHLTKPFQSIRQLVNQVTDLIESKRDVRPTDQVDEPASVDPGANDDEHTVPDDPFDQPVRSQLETFRDDRIASIDHQHTPPVDSLAESADVAVRSESHGSDPDDIDRLYRQSVGEEPLSPDSDLPDLGVDDEMIETSYSSLQSENDELDLSLPVGQELVSQQNKDAEEKPNEYEVLQPASRFETTDLNLADISEEEGALLPRRSDETVRLDPNVVDVQMAEANRRFEPIEQPPPPSTGSPVGEDTIRMESRFDTRSSGSYEFDDIDLLDIPPGTEVEISSPVDTAAKGGNKQIITLSPDLIELIAQRVVEKLSEKY